MAGTIRIGAAMAVALAFAFGGIAGVAAQELKISHQFKANADGRDLAARVFVEEVTRQDKNI